MFLKKKQTYQNDPSFISSYHSISRTRTATQDMGKEIGGKIILKAGSVYPANDETAEGIVVNDVDLTNGGYPVAVLVEGYVYEDRLPEEVTPEAKAVLKEIKFEAYNHGGE
ncbi:hypothetical protein [Shouchella lonarensis]|uniref:Bacteriophage lambda head decoration protein D n=1 Tax=Shouchella lonarensis TaxID=1464122 RepID=A0A1G6HRL2_9BACI|nr:hypothetical protein [Shouchella lonarensis]SDB96505.1 hypothetical protein SAMN05421737_104127 [Shouchella lonarensis]